MSYVGDNARPGVDRGEQRGARGRNGRRIQIDEAGDAKRSLDQVGEARDRGGKIAGGIGLVVREHQLVLPGGAKIRFVGLDFRDHRRQFRRRPRRQPSDRHVGQIVAPRIRQEFIGGEHPVVRLAQHGRQVVGFGAHVPEEIVVSGAGQHQHLRWFRPVGRRMAHEGRNRLRRPLAALQQVAGIFEHGHARAQPLPGAIIRQVLRRRLQFARGDHQIIDAVRFRQEPAVRRRRHRGQQRHFRRFNHRHALVAGRHRPGLVGQGARGVGNPGGVAGGVERQNQRFREGGGGHRRHASRANDGRAGAGGEIPGVFRRDAVDHEIAVVAGIGQHAAHGQHVGAGGGHAVRNRQHRRRGILVVEGQGPYRRAVETEFRAVVRIPGRGLRPPLHVHPERHGAPGIAGQPHRKIHPVRSRIGRADDGVPIIIVGGTLDRGHEGENVLFIAHLRRSQGRAFRSGGCAPRQRLPRSGPEQIGRVVRVPVGARPAEKHQPAAGGVEQRRHRPALAFQGQRTGGGERLHLGQLQTHAGGNRRQVYAIEALLPQLHLQHGGWTGGRRRPGPRCGSGRARRRLRRRREHHRVHAHIVPRAGNLRFLQAIARGFPRDCGRVHDLANRNGILRRDWQPGLVQKDFRARRRILAINPESRGAPGCGRTPNHPALVRPPLSPHIHDIRTRMKRRGFLSRSRKAPAGNGRHAPAPYQETDPPAESDPPASTPCLRFHRRALVYLINVRILLIYIRILLISTIIIMILL